MVFTCFYEFLPQQTHRLGRPFRWVNAPPLARSESIEATVVRPARG